MIGNYAAIGLSDTILINFHHLTVVCHKAIYFAFQATAAILRRGNNCGVAMWGCCHCWAYPATR